MYCAKNRNYNHTNNTEILAESKRTCIEYILRYLISELQPLVGRQRLLNLYFLVDVTGFKICGAVITPEITEFAGWKPRLSRRGGKPAFYILPSLFLRY